MRKIVIDTTCLVASLLRDSSSREIVLCPKFEFTSSDFVIEEIMKYHSVIVERSGSSEVELNRLMGTLFERIDIVPIELHIEEFRFSREILKDIDPKDAPHLAVGMYTHADGIWTEDKHFLRQSYLKVYTTKDLIELI